jgi:hypothetical protein
MSLARQTALASPKAKPASPATPAPMQRQRGPVGNQAALRQLSRASPRLQPKLEIGAVDDPLEREADMVADKVMRMPDPALTLSSAPPQVSRKCAACEEEDKKKLQMKPAAADLAAGGEAPPIVHDALASPGRSLDASTRAFFEPRLDTDLSAVRIHENSTAAASAQSLGAQAYAFGNDIVFGVGRFSPASADGRRLLAHELAHVVQQGGSAPPQANASRVRRYGHANYCTMANLDPHIWTGHPAGKDCALKTMTMLRASPTPPQVKASLDFFFGTGASARVSEIADNYKKIADSFDGDFMYHCSKSGDTSDSSAERCNGQNAQTSKSGKKDITLCFDNMSQWTPLWDKWVLIHEHVHRGVDVWGHSWVTRSLVGSTPCSDYKAMQGSADLANPDSYACFAVTWCDIPPVQGGQGGSASPHSAAEPGGQTAPQSVNSTLPAPQFKLLVGAQDDPREREADAIADTVMRMPDPILTAPADDFARATIRPETVSPSLRRKITMNSGLNLNTRGYNFTKVGDTYSAPAVVKTSMFHEIFTSLLWTPRVFFVRGATDQQVDQNLLGHVQARLGVIDFASKKKYGFGAGPNTRMNPAYWNVGATTGEIRPEIANKLDAIDDLNVHPELYKISCEAATKLTMQGGSREARLPETGPSSDPNDWVPGDWGYIKNIQYPPVGGRPGLEGENIIYVGKDLFWGHFNPGLEYKNLQGWIDEVNRFEPPTEAQLQDSRKCPGVGIV